MISSEVQRTLVKSPPELWAELGDPASLARHLGELGEIRITRIRPEEAIEWEAEGTTGTVLIKPSGWGTKVTLTVTRGVPTPEAPLAAQSPSEDQVEAQPAEFDPQPTAHLQLEPEPIAQAALEPEPMAQAEVEPEPMAEADVEGATEAQPAPDATVDLVEPTAVAEPEPVAEAEPIAPVEVAAEQEPERLTDAAAAVAETSEGDAELLPRRGFFARLFGRRQRQATVAIAPQPGEPYATDPNSEPQLPEAYETVWNVEPGVYEPYEPSAHAEPDPVAPSETVANAQPEPDPGETVADALEQPIEAWETAAYAESRPETPPAVAFDVEPPSEPEETMAEQVQERAQSANAQPPETGSELEQAEHAAAGEVTAVLTAVLDRLGAAHHRPFSRG